MATEASLTSEEVKVAFEFSRLEPQVQQQLEAYLYALHAEVLSKA
jgi:c-di-GMP-binding flagellar brake protein YcgR